MSVGDASAIDGLEYKVPWLFLAIFSAGSFNTSAALSTVFAAGACAALELKIRGLPTREVALMPIRAQSRQSMTMLSGFASGLDDSTCSRLSAIVTKAESKSIVQEII